MVLLVPTLRARSLTKVHRGQQTVPPFAAPSGKQADSKSWSRKEHAMVALLWLRFQHHPLIIMRLQTAAQQHFWAEWVVTGSSSGSNSGSCMKATHATNQVEHARYEQSKLQQIAVQLVITQSTACGKYGRMQLRWYRNFLHSRTIPVQRTTKRVQHKPHQNPQLESYYKAHYHTFTKQLSRHSQGANLRQSMEATFRQF